MILTVTCLTLAVAVPQQANPRLSVVRERFRQVREYIIYVIISNLPLISVTQDHNG